MLLGNVSSVKLLQLHNAAYPIIVMLLGNISSVKPLQS